MLANMNLARWIILLSLLGSAVLAYTGWQRRNMRIEWEEALEMEVPGRAQNVQILSRKLDKLTRDFNRQGLVGQDDDGTQSYIRGVAQKDSIVLGSINFNRSEKEPAKGVVDITYRVESNDPNRAFARANISNFLYEVERQSGRLRVTYLQLKPAQKGLKPQDIPNDRWHYRADVTLRQKKDEG